MRPMIYLFGDSITEGSFCDGGWGASLAHHFSRTVCCSSDFIFSSFPHDLRNIHMKASSTLFCLEYWVDEGGPFSFSFFLSVCLGSLGGLQADVVLRGYSGYNTRWALKVIERVFPEVDRGGGAPLAVTVFFGANDASLPDRCSAFQHVPIHEYKQNLHSIVSFLKVLNLRTKIIFRFIMVFNSFVPALSVALCVSHVWKKSSFFFSLKAV